jgi:hypothetical protein
VPDHARHLKVVEFDGNGEVIETDCAECRKLKDHIAGLESNLKGWAIKYAELKRDKATEAEEHPCWDAGKWLHTYWKQACRHPRSRWSHDRFWLIEPFLVHEKWGKTLHARVALCRLAIDGAAYDAWSVTRKNGSVKRFDDFDMIYSSTGKFEDFCKRAPAGAIARCKAARGET